MNLSNRQYFILVNIKIIFGGGRGFFFGGRGRGYDRRSSRIGYDRSYFGGRGGDRSYDGYYGYFGGRGGDRSYDGYYGYFVSSSFWWSFSWSLVLVVGYIRRYYDYGIRDYFYDYRRDFGGDYDGIRDYFYDYRRRDYDFGGDYDRRDYDYFGDYDVL
ncbi:unnamed protein product [Rotaria sp. Silwood2]|nr:unnamed protein product [Rotaria sp. Silwood2]